MAGVNSLNLDRLARVLAIVAGCLDLPTGIGLVAAPALTLRMMGIADPPSNPVYLQFVGAFVGAVGFSYLWAVRRWWKGGGTALLRATLEITIIFRLAAGLFTGVAIFRGALPPAWMSVPGTDLALAIAQAWLLRRGALKGDAQP